MKLFRCFIVLLGCCVVIAGAYIVKKGDTLWDLSEEFLGDPFEWPDLWEKNRHIQDPHWIYPGDSIYFGEEQAEEAETDSAQVEQEPQQAPPPPVKKATNCKTPPDSLPSGVKYAGCDDGGREGSFENMLGNLRSLSKIQKTEVQEDKYYYQQRSEPKIFNAYYQIHTPVTYTIDSLRKDSAWFSIISGEKREPIAHIPEMEVVVGIGRNTDIKAKKGDFVELWDAKRISIHSRDGKSTKEMALLQLSGYAKITAVGDTLSRATIMQAFREIYMKQTKARLMRPLNPINVNGYTPEKEASFDDMAQIVYAVDISLTVGAYSYVLIDRGLNHKFNMGDGVAIWERDKSDPNIPPRLLGRGVITGSQPEYATVLVREIYHNARRVDIGHSVSITHRASVVK